MIIITVCNINFSLLIQLNKISQLASECANAHTTDVTALTTKGQFRKTEHLLHTFYCYWPLQMSSLGFDLHSKMSSNYIT